MSLIIDNLKKLTNKSGHGSVPPGMINLAPKKRSKNPSVGLLALLVISVIGAGIVFYIGSDSATAYKVTPPVRTADRAQVNPPKPPQVKKPVQKQQAASEADIQTRIDEAVAKAMQGAEKDFQEKAQSSRDANTQRINSIDALPLPVEQKIIKAPKPPLKTPVPSIPATGGIIDQVNNIKALQAGLLTSGAGQTSAVADIPVVQKPAKPILSGKQREEFKKKVHYNTLVTIADRALRSKRYEKAIENYKKVMKIKPTGVNLVNLLKARIGSGDVAGVSDDLARYNSVVDEKVISITATEMNKFGYTDNGLGLLKSYLGRFDNDGKLYYTAGQIHEKKADNIRAEVAYSKAVDILTVEPFYIYAFARMLDTNKKYEKALEQYQRIDELQPDAELKIAASVRAQQLSEYLKKQEEDAKGESAAKPAEKS